MTDILEIYDYYIHKLGDDKNNWWVINTPWPTVTILCIYLYSVCYKIPKYMETRKPYDLKTFVRIYNIIQIISSAYLVYGLTHSGWTVRSMIGCQLVDQSNSPDALRIRKVINFGYCVRALELVETVIFALRKKNNQITTLHVYHHTTVVCIAWLMNKYVPGGMSTFPAILNSAIHVVMYSYYLLASLGPGIQKKLQVIKSQITMIQMVQFVIFIIHGLSSFRSGCNYSRAYFSMFIGNAMVLLFLFYQFYRKSYATKTHRKTNRS